MSYFHRHLLQKNCNDDDSSEFALVESVRQCHCPCTNRWYVCIAICVFVFETVFDVVWCHNLTLISCKIHHARADFTSPPPDPVGCCSSCRIDGGSRTSGCMCP